MHRLVGDQFLQERGRRVPGDARQIQEAGVEPGGQQLAQVGVEAIERRGPVLEREQVGPEIYQKFNAFRQGIELGE